MCCRVLVGITGCESGGKWAGLEGPSQLSSSVTGNSTGADGRLGPAGIGDQNGCTWPFRLAVLADLCGSRLRASRAGTARSRQRGFWVLEIRA